MLIHARVSLAAALLAFSAAWAGNPGSTISYQGRLLHDDQPVSGPLDLAFRLYDAPAGGNQIGPELTANGFDGFDDSGVFVIDLDFGAGAFTGQPRWMEIEVEGSTLVPRQPVLPVPYALFATSAAGGGGGWQPQGGNVAFLGGSVGIGTATPDATLEVVGEVLSTGPAGGSFIAYDPTDQTSAVRMDWLDDVARIRVGGDGVGAYNGLDIQRIGNVSLMRLLHNGNVGIGTSTPQAKLEVAGEVRSSGGLGGFVAYNPSNGTSLVRLDWLDDVARIRVGGDGAGAYNGLDIQSVGNASLMRITHQGFVGIGTTTPTAPLEIFTDGGLFDSSIEIDGFSINTTGLGLYLNDDAPAASEIALGRPGGGGVRVFGGSDAEFDNINGFIVVGDVATLNLAIDNNEIMARNNGNTATLFLNNDGGDVRVGGPGSKLITPVIQITGADLAERFPLSESVAPGVVVAIDPQRPGALCVARGAYNRCVAGVVSGAGDLPAGAILGNLPGCEDAPPVALSGRVWVQCVGPVAPGDLLTTSDTPGHAMRVSDHARAQGAVIGKAMTALGEGTEQGTGLVLVLVSLQ
jgi:hypothetical protein